MAMGQALPGMSIRSAYYLDPVTGERKDMLAGGGVTSQAGIPMLQNQADENVYQAATASAQNLWDPNRQTFIRPPRSDAEAAAMNAFMEQLQSRDHEMRKQRKRQRLNQLLTLFGLSNGGNPRTGGF